MITNNYLTRDRLHDSSLYCPTYKAGAIIGRNNDRGCILCGHHGSLRDSYGFLSGCDVPLSSNFRLREAFCLTPRCNLSCGGHAKYSMASTKTSKPFACRGWPRTEPTRCPETGRRFGDAHKHRHPVKIGRQRHRGLPLPNIRCSRCVP